MGTIKTEGKLVYDPRTKEYVSAHNPALILADLMILAGKEVDWDYISKMADVCDFANWTVEGLVL